MASPEVELFYAAAKGDLAQVKALVKEGVNLSYCGTDGKTPLHIAATEGHADVVDFLVSSGVDLGIEDKFGNSALSSAVVLGKEDVVKILKDHGSQLTGASRSQIAIELCRAAAEDDVKELARLVKAGADLSWTDYNNRTPLHIATSLGNVNAVKYLLENGCDSNAVDFMGNSPLDDASRGASKSKRLVRKLLMDYGAREGNDLFHARNSLEFTEAISQSLPLLCARGNYVYAEVWTPTDNGEGLIPLSPWYAEKPYQSDFERFQVRYSTDVLVLEKGKGLAGAALVSQQAVSLLELTDDQYGVHSTMIKQLQLRSGIAVPIRRGGVTLAVLVFFGVEDHTYEQDDLVEFYSYANGLVMSGFMQQAVQFLAFTGISSDKVTAVYELLVAERVFNPRHIYQEVDWWFRMEIPAIYYSSFDIKSIASHIHCFMAAKKLSQAMGNTEQAMFAKMESNKGMECVYMCPATYADSVKVETEIERNIEHSVPEGHAISIKYLCSRRPFVPNGSRQLSLYIIEVTPYVTTVVRPEETDIWKISSGKFLAEKAFAIRKRYQDIIKASSLRLAPIPQVSEIHADGTTPVSLSIRHSHRASFLLRFTEVLKIFHIGCSRKFVETFSNGVVVYTFYLQTNDSKIIEQVVHQMQLISLVPGTTLRHLFLDGSLSVEEYAYVSCVRKFIYYFMNQSDEDTNILATVLKHDPLNLARLSRMRVKMKREAVSTVRITKCLTSSLPIVKKMFADFVSCAHNGPKMNHALETEILRHGVDALDQQILTAFLLFNSNLQKTNFWRTTKAALSFSFKPSFVQASGYPENPHTLFFVLGTEFQGFHVRFRDIARGGIRVIKSANKTAFLKNMEGQFTENYDLAYTQNLKNKDIPEFGSKGTVLLNREAQGATRVAFQKYVSGLLDLLVVRKDMGVIDHTSGEEILFLGPDENTADVMDWAAIYARYRGYKYWKAFTTGKPPSLGGVPHDTYGMTTRSVHTYVLGCLEKCGMQEENVTKVQTGGPDGDLGSNEILISKDKTIVLIDGSGVLYDPEGIDRTELSRLASTRKMIDQFDDRLLHLGGFRVLITDTNVILPTGEAVENGLLFRNEFHLHPLVTADLFVPCGGRPQSVNMGNVKRMFKEDGTPKFKIIVEGANLFLTQDARNILEKAGVILYRDASANKGGVTSSSYEVLAALSMTDEEHGEHMQVKDLENPPQFYQDYVKDIQEAIERNARKEFAAIWDEHVRTGIPRSILTDHLSEKINKLNDQIEASTLYQNLELRKGIMKRVIPQTLQNLLPLEVIIERLPVNYARAIFNAFLASSFVYKYGLQPSEFSFFEFVQEMGVSSNAALEYMQTHRVEE